MDSPLIAPALASTVFLATVAPDWHDLAWAVAAAALSAVLQWLTARRKQP